jgi:hypothetical protein
LFVKPAQAVNAYLSEPNYLESTLKYSGQQTEQVEQIVSYLVTNKPLTFEECIIWARLQFEAKYNNEIRQLLFSLPKDALTKSGHPFWSSPKRAPDPLTFNSNDVSRAYEITYLELTFYTFVSPSTFNSSSLLPISMPLTTGCGAKRISPLSANSLIQSSSPNSPRRVVSQFKSLRMILFRKLGVVVHIPASLSLCSQRLTGFCR